jgi:hypothetical protein
VASKDEQEFFDACKVIYAGSTTTTAVANLDIGKDFVDMPSHSPVDEAHNDYYDLPSNPISIFHTGPAWPLPTGYQS